VSNATPEVKPESQSTVTGTAEGAAVHDAEAEELEVDDVAVIEMDDELVVSVELGELLEIVELDEELESELEAAALEDELEATELELEEGQGGERMNATCHEESVTSWGLATNERKQSLSLEPCSLLKAMRLS
jgi:hypothetical protein